MSGRTFRLVVPGRPFLLNRERKLHPRARAAEVRYWRGAAKLLARHAPLLDAVTVTARPHVRDRIPQDVAACYPSAKAIIDGLVDAGVLRNDGPSVVTALTFLPVRLGSPEGDAVEVIVEEVAPCASR
jgi:crossover junction endodeoxyribonuclease RusA